MVIIMQGQIVVIIMLAVQGYVVTPMASPPLVEEKKKSEWSETNLSIL